MTTIRILLSLMFAGWLMPSYGQNCAEPIIKYLYGTEDPCGYHGALNLDLIGKTALEKADDFVDIWKSEILSGASDKYQFQNTEVKKLGKLTIVKYQLAFDRTLIKNISLNLIFDKNLRLKGYSCNNASQLPKPMKEGGIVGKILDSSSEKLLKEYAPEALHRIMRKSTKTKGAFINDMALEKQLYLTLQYNKKSWQQKTRGWPAKSKKQNRQF